MTVLSARRLLPPLALVAASVLVVGCAPQDTASETSAASSGRCVGSRPWLSRRTSEIFSESYSFI